MLRPTNGKNGVLLRTESLFSTSFSQSLLPHDSVIQSLANGIVEVDSVLNNLVHSVCQERTKGNSDKLHARLTKGQNMGCDSVLLRAKHEVDDQQLTYSRTLQRKMGHTAYAGTGHESTKSHSPYPDQRYRRRVARTKIVRGWLKRHYGQRRTKKGSLMGPKSITHLLACRPLNPTKPCRSNAPKRLHQARRCDPEESNPSGCASSPTGVTSNFPLPEEVPLSVLPKGCTFEGDLTRDESVHTEMGHPPISPQVTGPLSVATNNTAPWSTDLQYKPPVPRRPLIWAQSRQEICEGFDWFRSYQGGVYFANNVVRGYLLSAFAAHRDRFAHGGRLIISHGGGKAESIHSNRGQSATQPADDQLAGDKSVRALLANYHEGRPLVLIIDDKYNLFPYDLGAKDVTYAVLGLYMVVSAWAEYQPSNNDRGRVVRYKFAFQWCAGQGKPWWLPEEAEVPSDAPLPAPQPVRSRQLPVKSSIEPASGPPAGRVALEIYCHNCQQKSPQVYTAGWACLNPHCRSFWVLTNGVCLPDQLKYTPDFLQLSDSITAPPGFSDIRPSPPQPNADGTTVSHAFSKGWHCRECGRLSCRVKWEHWECPNCKDVYQIPGRICTVKDFWQQPLPVTFRDHFVAKGSGIRSLPAKVFECDGKMALCQTFVLPHDRGKIHHIQNTNAMGRAEADTIFHEYQVQAATGELAFRRWPLRAHKLRGPLLTNYFSHNSGEPYQYVGGTDNTVPWSAAPSAVVKARRFIELRMNDALGFPVEFNEVLSAGYMERQRMAFHSDAEIGLGPIVAGLSLGSPALMHFRSHPRYEKDREHRSIVLSFVLRHGDVLVMDGAEVQQCYEHTVVPTNFRIAATARWIQPGMEIKKAQ